MWIDHVVLAADDLDATASGLLERYGLASLPGGAHPLWGTANRIVPLGGQYLEIVGVIDRDVADGNPFGRWIRAAAANGAVLAGLMVAPDDFDAVCSRLSLTPALGQRIRPDGVSLSWRLAGMAEAMSRTVPCFISWNHRDDTFGGDAGVGATGIANLELSGDAHQITTWLGGNVDGLTLTEGAPGLRRLTIATRSGQIVVPQQPFE